MQAGDFMLIAIVAAFSIFGGALAWASWDETRRQRR
jgi:hypothetical protein